jgi:hypothetical protein
MEFTSEQKSQAGVIVTIGHNGKAVYHCGLVKHENVFYRVKKGDLFEAL